MALSYLNGRMYGLESDRPLTTTNIPPGTPFYATDIATTFVAQADGWHIGDLTEVTFAARVASTANLAAISGLAAIDGVAIVAGDLVLLKDQTTKSQNGMYVAAAGAWSRYTGYVDVNGNVARGARVVVREGTLGKGQWLVTGNAASLTPGVSNLFYVRCLGRKVFGSDALVGGAASVNTYIKTGATILLTPFAAPVAVGGLTASTLGVTGTGTDGFYWEVTNPT